MIRFALGFVLAACVFAGLDFVWLSLSYPRLYQPEIGALMAAKPDMTAGVAFYLIYLFGMTWFAIAPAAAPSGGGAAKAALNGALFGFVAYATYDLTNQSTLKLWSLKVTLCDLAWGTFATATAAALSCAATRRLVKA